MAVTKVKRNLLLNATSVSKVEAVYGRRRLSALVDHLLDEWAKTQPPLKETPCAQPPQPAL